MSADPTQMAQLLQMYKQMFPNGLPNSPQAQAYQQAQAPGQAAMAMGNVPPGTNTGAGASNAVAKLVLALLQKKRMQDYNQQYPQGTTPMGGPTNPSSGAPVSPASADPGLAPG